MNFELEWLRGFFLSNDTDCNLGEPTSFILSGSDLHLKQNHPSKQKGVFHLTIKNRWASFCQVTATCRGYTNTTTNLSAVCTGEFLWKSLSPQQNFVAATCRRTKKSNQTEFVRLVAPTKFCCRKNDFFTKILRYTRSDLSLRRVAVTCCWLVYSILRNETKRNEF